LNATIAKTFREAAKAAGVILIDADLSRQQMYGLLSVCDCYVSLHRAEGFGLGIAESMALGKPVIATAHSGNMDFMTPANSFGVNYTLRPITTEDHAQQPFLLDVYQANPEQLWGEPDIDHAAELMRYVCEHPDEARQRGETALRDMAEGWSVEAIGARIHDRLDTLSRTHNPSD
jgi:glycosyltransferase involved in cell wall biosynthesis